MSEKVLEIENPLEHVTKPDAVTKYKAVEIEKDGKKTAIRDAVIRLRDSSKPQKVLIVQAESIEIAKDIMKEIGVSGTLRDISDTYRGYLT